LLANTPCRGVAIYEKLGDGRKVLSFRHLFRNLTQGFVNFATILYQAQAGDADAANRIPAAGADFRHSAGKGAFYMWSLVSECSFAHTVTCTSVGIYGEINTKRIRELYLQAVLRQDTAFFDNVGAGEVATRISTVTHLVKQGISEKVALVANFFGAFVCGFALA